MSVSYLTIEEFSKAHPFLKVGTLRRMVRDGQIDYIQPRGKGGNIFIPDNALEDLVVRASPDAAEGDDVAVVEAGVKQLTRRRSGRLPNWKRKH